MTIVMPPRLGFLGGVEAAPGTVWTSDLDELLERDLDGVVIDVPTALHADQAMAALGEGLAVFCQQPLGRNAEETRRVLGAAREADRLLAVDFAYRDMEALRAAQAIATSGEIGLIHSLDLSFHNAPGPDKDWCTKPELAGGGCLLDLGTHLVDLALCLTGASEFEVETARLLSLQGYEVEDHATAELTLGEDMRARLTCSWFQSLGRESSFECTAWGSDGAVSVRNIGGSPCCLQAELWHGTSSQILVEPPAEGDGRAIATWAQRLATDPGYNPTTDALELVAESIDAIYARASR